MEALTQEQTAAIVPPPTKELRLDLGCGKMKREGFVGVDSLPFPGVDVVFDLASDQPWPWADDSVDEVRCSHMVEHLDGAQRIRFVNELYRVMKKGAKAQIVTPHWASNRAYGDLTHKWPPVSEMWFCYLNAGWRLENAPHNDGYTCNFEAMWGYGVNPILEVKSHEFKEHALAWFKEAAMDLVATLTKR